MTKLQKRKTIVITVGVFLLLVVIIVGAILIFGKKKPEVEPNVEIPTEVTPEKANELFSVLTEKCTGAMVWGTEIGKVVEINNIEEHATACQSNNYFQKMIGYTIENENVVMHVAVLKKVDNNVYTLNDVLVGEYSENEINNLLDSGSNYLYTYTKTGEDYKLSKVEFVDTSGEIAPPDENTEEEAQ